MHSPNPFRRCKQHLVTYLARLVAWQACKHNSFLLFLHTLVVRLGKALKYFFPHTHLQGIYHRDRNQCWVLHHSNIPRKTAIQNMWIPCFLLYLRNCMPSYGKKHLYWQSNSNERRKLTLIRDVAESYSGSYFVYRMQMRTHCLSIVLWVIVLLFDVFCSYYFTSSVSATPSKSCYVRVMVQRASPERGESTRAFFGRVCSAGVSKFGPCFKKTCPKIIPRSRQGTTIVS